MTDVTQRNQAAYDRIAPVYAQRNMGPMPENLLHWAQHLVKYGKPTSHLLEIGCGVGRDMAWFEAQGVQVTGLDLSLGMLTIARQYVRGALYIMDMRHLAFCDAQFDSAWCCASLLHLPKQEASLALAEIRRVLKPASLVMVSIQAGDSEGWEGGYMDGVKRFFARYTAEEMTQLLAANQFTVKEMDETSAGQRRWLSFLSQTV